MALKIELKPHERFIVGSTVIANGDHRAHLYIDGNEPLLREKDILTAETANSPAKRIYLTIQLMYLNNDIASNRELYFGLVNDFLEAVPSSASIIHDVNNKIVTGSLYHALKKARELIDYEQELMGNAKPSSRGISENVADDGDGPGTGGQPSSQSGRPASDHPR